MAYNFPKTLPVQTGNSDKVLSTDGSNSTWQYAGLGSGSTFPSNTVIVGLGLPSGMTATSSVLIGTGSNLGTGTGQVIIGASSGRSTTGATGANNIIVGANSYNGASLTSAYFNVIVGQAAGTAFTTGGYNVGVGNQTLSQLATGFYNTAIGAQAGSTYTQEGITGDSNVCVGFRAGVRTVVGNVNQATALGTIAGASSNSVAVGYYSQVDNYYSVAVGANTRANGTYSTIIGFSSSVNPSGFGSNGASQTTTLGALTAGASLTTGFATNTRCLYLGAYAGSYSSGKTDEFMLDNQDRSNYAGTQTKSLMYGAFNSTPSSQTLTFNATTTSTYGLVANEIGGDFDTRIEGDTDVNLIFVDASTDRVGIGTATPGEKLEVNGNVKVSSGDLSIATVGKGLAIKSGSNAKIGVTSTFPASNPNSVTVSTTAVTANSLILITAQSNTGGLTNPLAISAITAGTSFVITTSDNSFAGTVGWMIVEQS